MPLLDFEGFAALPLMRPVWLPTTTPVVRPGRTAGEKAFGTDAATGVATLSFPSSPATIVVGFSFLLTNTTPLASTSANYRLLALEADNAATEHLSFNFTADGKLQVRRGAASAAVIATSALPVTGLNEYHHFEVKATISDTVGICQVKIDGVQVINFTGDTKNAGTATTWSGLELSMSPSIQYAAMHVLDGSGAAPNDFIGDHRVVIGRPSSSGAESDFLGSDADSTDNWMLVDEDPISILDWVSSSTPGDRDLYEHTDVSGSPLPTVVAVRQVAYAQKTDAGDRSLKFLARSAGGTVLASAAVPLSASWTVLAGPLMVTDAEAAAWTAGNLNSHQFGMETV